MKASLYSTQHANLAALYRALGGGLGIGLISAGLSHAVSGKPNLFVMMVFYGMFMFYMRGWKEFCALLSMLGTIVAYFAVYEAFKLDSSLKVSIGLSLFAVALYVVYIASIVNRTVKLRSRILARMGPLRTREALDLPLRDTEHWLEPTFAAVRAWKATGQLLLSRIVFPAVSRGVLAVAGLLLSVWFDNALLVGLSAGLFLYQSVAITRLGRYYQRLSLPGVGDVLAKDSRAPILFLRPFALDEVPVSPLEDGWYGIRDISLSLDRRTFEEALKVVFDDIGPIIAIGRSGEGAAPIGAAREYTDDTSWQQRVLERADIAQFVIIACDATPSMIWEIQNVSKRLGLRRIVMVLPLDDHGYQKRAPEWYARWASLRDKFAFLPEVSDDAVAVMFDKDDAAIVVSSDASSLEKRLTTIKEAWLENSR